MDPNKKHKLIINRREFLTYSCACSILCLAPFSLMSRSKDSVINSNYYVINKEKFIKSFDVAANSAGRYLQNKYDIEIVDAICKEAKEEFEKLLPHLPYIGGDENGGTRWILLAGHWRAFYIPMQARGIHVSETGQMMYDLYVEYLDETPMEEFRKRGESRLSKEGIEEIRKWLEENKEPKYKHEWVSKFIQGDGDNFDYGIDYTYCPCSDYFKSNNAKELAPYFCLIDFPEHKRMGTGLVRKKTLAAGDEVCDFRFKKGREVWQDWSTEAPELKSKF